MKTSIAYIILVGGILASVSNAWSMPKIAFKKAISVATIAAAVATAPLVSHAEYPVSNPNDYPDFSGSYNDPKHPNCLRVINVVGDNAILKGSDGNPGCNEDGSGGKQWTLKGKVDGRNIKVDFSRKGGPRNAVGMWESAEVPNVQGTERGIRWPDGNKWTVYDIE